MGKAHYTLLNFTSSGISSKSVGIQSDGSDMLAASMRRRSPIKEILARKMREADVSPYDIVRNAAGKGVKIGRTSITEILNGNTQNPGIFTLEPIALGLHLSPEQFMAEILGSRADDPNFKGSQFAMLYEIYKGMTPTQRAKAEPHVDGLLLQLSHIKNQK